MRSSFAPLRAARAKAFSCASFVSHMRGVSSVAPLLVALAAAVSPASQASAQCAIPSPPVDVPATPSSCAAPNSNSSIGVAAIGGNCYIRDFKFTSVDINDHGSYSSPPAARVILPRSYYSNPTKRYPVIYLLHGANESLTTQGVDRSYQAWSENVTSSCDFVGDVFQDLTDRDVILVSPEGGRYGWFSDWVYANDGNLRYETFFFNLISWVDGNFNTINAREKRAVAGLSMGGYGATKFAAKHPDKFVSVAAFSGALNSQDHTAGFWFGGNNGVGQADLMKGGSTLVAGYNSSLFGTAADSAPIWTTNNPTRLSENYRNMHVYLTAGTGCSFFDTNCDGPGSVIETEGVLDVVRDFRTGLESARNPVGTGTLQVNYTYSPITYAAHNWANWRNAFRRYLTAVYPLLTAATVPNEYKVPTVWSYLFGESFNAIYGWYVVLLDSTGNAQDDYLTVNRFAVNGTTGFTLQGSGSARVTTGKIFTPGVKYRVTFSNPTIAIPQQVITASSQGALVILPFALSNSSETAVTSATITVF